jgi:hypothetical protein
VAARHRNSRASSASTSSTSRATATRHTGVLADLAQAPAVAEVVTLTAGGNDLLLGHLPRAISAASTGSKDKSSRSGRKAASVELKLGDL